MAEALRDLMQAGEDYLAGNLNIAGLNGQVSIAKKYLDQSKTHVAVKEMLDDWHTMVDRAWNELGHVKHPLTDEEFRAWLEGQLGRD